MLKLNPIIRSFTPTQQDPFPLKLYDVELRVCPAKTLNVLLTLHVMQKNTTTHTHTSLWTRRSETNSSRRFSPQGFRVYGVDVPFGG